MHAANKIPFSENVHKKARVYGEKNKGICMKRLTKVSKAREVCQDRVLFGRSIVSAYLNGNLKGVSIPL